jgi:tetratricopeptide (TPR) repeat protein
MTSYREALKRNPDFVASRLKLAELHLNRREYASADSLFRDLAAGESRWARATARYGLALIPTFQGKLERAEQLLDQGIAADKLEKEEAGQLPEHAASGKGLLVWVLVASGATDEAERLFHEIDRQVPRDRADLTQTRDLAESAIAAARGDTTRSLDALRKIGEKPNSVVSFWVGFGYLNLGRIEEAVRHLERCLTTYDDERRALGPSLVLCHYYLGSAYEQSGWKQKAAAEYREFLAFWGDGDPGIEEVEDARKRLALVGGGT